MATNTKQARRDAEFKINDYEQSYLNRFKSLYHNSVTVTGIDEKELPKRYLIGTLLKHGAIAHDHETNVYLPFTAAGVDMYGLPTTYTLVGANGTVLMRKPEEVDILKANDAKYPLLNYLLIQIAKLVKFDMAIEQNLEAIKTMTVVEVADQKTLLSMGNLAESRQIGSSLAFVNKSAKSMGNITVSSTGAQYLIDKLMIDKDKILKETLSTIGTGTANTDKKERVESFELKASEYYAVDSIKTLIDTFNHDAEVAGLTIRLTGNTSLIEEDNNKDDDIQQEGEENDLL